jgi:hypothetical protein
LPGKVISESTVLALPKFCFIFVADHVRFVGVAPEANLLSFKVFTSDGYSNEETVIEGFLKAFESGVSDASKAPLPLRLFLGISVSETEF